jgi:hypothetical protein
MKQYEIKSHDDFEKHMKLYLVVENGICESIFAESFHQANICDSMVFVQIVVIGFNIIFFRPK